MGSSQSVTTTAADVSEVFRALGHDLTAREVSCTQLTKRLTHTIQLRVIMRGLGSRQESTGPQNRPRYIVRRSVQCHYADYCYQ